MDACFVGWSREQKLAEKGYLKFFRTVRNQCLTDSDWSMMPDAPLSEPQRAAWRMYRQALRDLPQTTDLGSPDFPQPPQ